jgi:hypothetical protein
MAKRSYLDSNPNYRSAKKFMKGMNAGGVELPDEEITRKIIINAILESPTLERLYEQWTRVDPKTGESPQMAGYKFEEFPGTEPRNIEYLMEAHPQPFLKRHEIGIPDDFAATWDPQSAGPKKHKKPENRKPKFKPSKPILIKKKDKED